MDSKIIGGTGGGMERKRGVTDFYPTPPEVTQTLLDYLQIPKGKLIWEPACGEGDMVMQLMKSGYLVYGCWVKREEGKDEIHAGKSV